jgi:cell division protein FtsQ
MAKERINRLKEPRKPFKLVALKLLKKLTYLFIFLLIASLIYVIDNSDLFEPKISWEVDGSLTTETAQYERLIKTLLNNKYLIDLSQLKERVEQYPWAAKADVSRVFWNKIRIAIVKHDIAMRWGSEGYISNQGVLFKPNLSIDSDAPIAIVSEEQIEQFYLDFINYQSTLGPLIIKLFERSHIDQLTLKPNVKVILGYQHQVERLQVFIKAYDKLKESSKIRKRGIFDMRYPKGFALSYSPQ